MAEFSKSREAAFVTFYSFKGGVGRSMALINVAGILAGRGFRVLALDMDLEAPGISYLMRHEANLKKQDLPGFIDLLADACERGEEGDLFALPPEEAVQRYSYLYTVPEPIRRSEDGLLRIMPAGRFDGHYQERLDQLDLGQLYREGQGQPLIEVFKQVVRASGMFDYVFIDSRTGFSDESGICTRDLGDYLVVVMGLNRQNQEGTAEFLHSLRLAKVEPKGVRVVLSSVPNGEDELVEQREKEAAAALSEAFGKDVSLSLQIPYHPRLALTEELHIFRRSRGYLYEAYVEIEKAVLAMLGMTAGSLLKQLRNAVEAKAQAEVLALLKRLVKLDDGNAALEKAAFEFSSFVVDEASGELRKFLAEQLSGDSWLVGHIATELHKRKQTDADLFYRLAIKAAPKDANSLGNYAIFLTDIRGDHAGAEVLYKRALEADPKNVGILGNYAGFLKNIRGDHAGAEELYKRALATDPKHANSLGNYAIFLKNIRGDHDGADELYKRSLEADPKHAGILGNYALFLTDIRGDHAGAEELYRRSLEADPKNPNHLGNYAKLLLMLGRDEDGERNLTRAWESNPEERDLQCELHFYAVAHLWNKHPDALPKLKSLLQNGASSKDWPLGENVRRSREAGHPQPEFVAALADVVSGKVPVESLEEFEVWKKRSSDAHTTYLLTSAGALA
ncbi:MAG: tetratricopeptide repeat protein [Verrucomicrobiales bacterium]